MMLPAACFVAILIGGIWPLAAPFLPRPEVPTTAEQLRADHAEMQCFAVAIARNTAPRSSIRMIVPDEFWDGGLVNHRLRHVITGRHVTLDGKGDYVAAWRSPEPQGRVIWRGCGGVLVRP